MDQKHVLTQRNQFPVGRAQHLLPRVRPSMILKVPRNDGDNPSRSHANHLNHQPVASGSHVRLGVAAEMDSDTASDSGDAMKSDTDEEHLLFPLDLRGGTGTHDPRFDSDGDFYGRGKDVFVGPTADSGEYVTKTFRINVFLFLPCS